MADPKHTPPPWRVEAGYRVEAEGFGLIAAVRGADGDPETIANAYLIAAAPDLRNAVVAHLAARDALESASIHSLSPDDYRFADVTDTLDAMRAAITEAIPQPQEA